MKFKVCTKCKKELSVDNFYKSKYGKDGVCSSCKQCQNKLKKECCAKRRDHYNKIAKESQKRRRLKNPKLGRTEHLKHSYGLSLSDFDLLVSQQSGKCAICGANTKLFVDHSHDSLVIRGLLCNKCNLGLGLFNDNPELLKQAAEYLKRIGSLQ